MAGITDYLNVLSSYSAPLASPVASADPSWMQAPKMVPMSNTRILPETPLSSGGPMASADRGFLNSNLGYTGMESPDVPGGPSLFSQLGSWLRDSGALGSIDQNGVKTEGWGGLALSGASSLANLWLGMQQYNLAKDQLSFGKQAFEKNFEAQRKSTNSALSDRQAARVASNPGAYESVGDYMKKWGV